MSSHIIKALGSKVPERFVATHAAKHQRSWWAAEGKNSATGSFAAHRLFTIVSIPDF